MKRSTPAPLAIAALLPLAGCISFGAKPPPALLTLEEPDMGQAARQVSSATAKTVTVNTPSVAQELATVRVPVQVTPTMVAYVTKAQWVDTPARLFAHLLADTLTVRTGRVVLTGAQTTSDPGARLGGELQRFGIDASSNQAVVAYDATLIRAASTDVVKRRFEARVPVSAIDGTTVGPALSQAASQVADQVSDWVGK